MACEAPVFFSITTDQDRGPLKVVFSAGGTGGHVFPAIALADALKALHPSCCISFVGTKHRLEASAVPLAGYPFHPIQAVALIRPVFSLSNLLLPFRITASLCLALILIFRLRPHVVVGTGGYVSAPLCLAAALTGCPFVIQEQNAYAGMTNKVFSRFATIIFVAFSAAIRHFPSRKCILCGNPVRSSLQHPIPKEVFMKYFYMMLQLRSNCLGLLLYFVGNNMHRFFNDMNAAYSAADIVVSRSGAITCSELLTAGKPSILIPSMNVTDDHQTKNAMAMLEMGTSVIILDRDLDSQKLQHSINKLIGDHKTKLCMRENALRAAFPDAASLIAKEILLLAKHHYPLISTT